MLGSYKLNNVLYNLIIKSHFLALYFRESDGIIIVYDITNQESFDNVENWKNILYENLDKDIPVFLWGNKIDLFESRVISSEEGCNAAEKLNVGFIEVSAKEGTNISELFTHLTSQIIDRKKII